MTNIRALAATILVDIVQQRSSLSDLLPDQKQPLSQQDEALLQELCYGVCRWYLRLVRISRELLDKPLKEKDTDLSLLILLGIYQLLYMRTPAHAAINETVNATKKLDKPWARGLVNAVLRRFQREQEQLLLTLKTDPEFNYSHPQWLLQRLQQAWPEHWQHICVGNNERSPMTLRINSQRTSRDSYLQQLQNAGIEAEICALSAQGIQLHQPCPVSRLPDFEQGTVSVQDEAAQLATDFLSLSPGLRVLDACAAPGGKTCHILEREPHLSELWAVELEQQRMVKLQDNLNRLQLSAKLVQADVSLPDTWWDKLTFDRILLDAPCSATGVIRRHPDIKLLRRNVDIDKLAKQQLRMLQSLWPLLKPGGILVYATCSVLPQENEQVIAEFLTHNSDAQHQKIDVAWGIAGIVGRYLLPQKNGPDGFYYARLQKALNNN